ARQRVGAHSQCGGLCTYIDRAARCLPRLRQAGGRGASLEHLPPRALPQAHLYQRGRARRHRRLRAAILFAGNRCDSCARQGSQMIAKTPKPGANGPKAARADLVRELAALLEETGLNEIEVEQDGMRIRVARGGGMMAMPMPDPGAPVRMVPASAPTP